MKAELLAAFLFGADHLSVDISSSLILTLAHNPQGTFSVRIGSNTRMFTRLKVTSP